MSYIGRSGFDAGKVAASLNVTEEEIRREVRAAIDRYALKGSFILGNLTLMGEGSLDKRQIGGIIVDEVEEYGKGYYNFCSKI